MRRAGCVIVLRVSPRFAVIDSSLTESISFHAASRPPRTSNETTPPNPVCCRLASANWG